ncbi:MAG TPA: dihydrodipicolinate synthase family protein [Acidobacteriota bacterium]|jgi:dihydrodipicolinate synthase/N-acetylneuraminate lyase
MKDASPKVKRGLIVPAATALDDKGEIIVAEQRRLLRHCIDGGAAAIFSPGTTGEFLRLRNGQRNQLMEIAVEEVSRYCRQDAKPEAWPVINGSTVSQTLENLRLAIRLKVDSAVVAPLAVADLEREDIPKFLGEIISIVKEHSPRMPVCLYENPEIAKHENLTLLPPDLLRRLCEAPEVGGIKVSAGADVVQSMLANLRLLHRDNLLEIYLGYATLIFSMDVPNSPIAGIVAGAGNLFPRQWALAWNAAAMGDRRRAAIYRQPLEKLETAIGPKYVSAIKWGLVEMGLLSRPDTASGTRTLSDGDAQEFLTKFREIRRDLESLE